MAERIEPFEKKAAKERQGTRTDKHPAKMAESTKGDSREKIASAEALAMAERLEPFEKEAAAKRKAQAPGESQGKKKISQENFSGERSTRAREE